MPNSAPVFDFGEGGDITGRADGYIKLGPEASVFNNSVTTTFIDPDISITDNELSVLNNGRGNFDGASLTLARATGADPEDVFSFRTVWRGLEMVDDTLQIQGTTIANITNTPGQLTVTFTDDNGRIPTTADVNSVLRQVLYTNPATTAANFDLLWTFSDGNEGAQGSGGPGVTTGITNVNIVTTATVASINDDLSPSRLDEGWYGEDFQIGTFTAGDEDGDAFVIEFEHRNFFVRPTATAGEFGLYIRSGTYVDFEVQPLFDLQLKIWPSNYKEIAPDPSGDNTSRVWYYEYLSSVASSQSFSIDVTDIADENIDASTATQNLVMIASGPEDMRLIGGSGNDRMEAGSGNDVLNGGAGRDTIEGGDGNDFIIGADGNDRLYGEDGDDRLQGHAGNDYLEGGAGNDTLNGGIGDDTVIGGPGDDLLFGLDGNDHLIAGNGNDTLFGGEGNDRFYAQAGDDVVHGGTGSNTVHLGAGNDQFFGAMTGNDTVYGIVGHDTIFGGGGDDVLWGQLGHDVIYGGDGNDQIQGGVGHDSLNGGAGNDRIDAGPGWDTIDGGAGSDTLSGGRGNDLLTGGTGADTFIFDARGGWDTVTDFERGIDTIEITYDGANFAQLGVSQVGSNTVIWYGSGGIILNDLDMSQISIEDFIFS